MGLRNKKTGKIVAMKQIASNQKSARECTLYWLAQKDCEYITKIDGLFLNRNNGRDYFYCFMECMSGGELFDYIAKRDKERHQRLQSGDTTQTSIFTEREVASMIRMIAKALYHLHKELGTAHRDLKPENILLTKDFEPGKSGMIKLTDFGFAKEAISSNKTKALATSCYTPYYVAPEIFGNERYDFACDVWSLGVILYILLVGYPPFYSFSGQNTLTPRMKKNIKEANFDINTEEFRTISDDAKDLLEKMLRAKPTERIPIGDVMKHPWIMQDIMQIPENKVQFGENASEYLRTRGRKDINDAMTEELKNQRIDPVVQPIAIMDKGRLGKRLQNRKNNRKRGNGGLENVSETGNVTESGNAGPKIGKQHSN